MTESLVPAPRAGAPHFPNCFYPVEAMASSLPSHVSDRTVLLSADPEALFYGPPHLARPRAAEGRSPRSPGRHRVALVLLAAGLVSGFAATFPSCAAVSQRCGLPEPFLPSHQYSHIALSRGVQLPLLVAAWLCAQGLLSCSLSPNIWALALSRVVVGLGKSGRSLLTVIVISDLVNVTEIPLWSYGEAECSSFDAEYAMMFVSCALVAISAAFARSARVDLLPPMPGLSERPFDALGAVTLLVAIVAPLMAISLGGEMLPWTHPLEMALLCISPLFLALFCWVESRAALPIIPMGLLRNKNALMVIAAAAGVIFNLSLYIDIQSAVILKDWAPSVIFAARLFGAILAGVIVKKTKRFKKLLVINMALLAAAYSTLAFTSTTTGSITYITLLAAVGFAMGIVENCLITALFLVVDKIASHDLISC
ncbi:hypothetical protein GGTG_05419 [Gaeumannomyces tritici R3-111a-1]|uniref:Uncharacterized protein n=1 Tax=Gaeumannomyces tritici (strain R3-111a-1) TaxID=644352 RepID=J3NVV7_GAET3|nr:hypothetical protein GGTG_05419 [Gaeumannomyces tritici R3-111a-1]EJT75486.1 hypothetical protein GGTG_05419 [Gaeumannomyces tritici R3-111a-1]